MTEEIEWTGKCGECGTCAFKMTNGKYYPCDCKYLLWNKVRYLWRVGYRKEWITLQDGIYDLLFLNVNLSIWHKSIFSLASHIGFKKWKIRLGVFWLYFFEKEMIDYTYD